ncbi:Glutamate-cysteine ligase [Venturia nashicola]|nr:Glutamate-cysteine ligase [Venturia nashicola]
MTRHTPFLCNHCFKWNASYTDPICWLCNHRKAETCFPNPILLLKDQYVFTVDEYREHSEFPIKQREELRTLKDAYENTVAHEARGIHESHTPSSKLRALFKGGRGGEGEESIHDVYLARKKEIMERKEERRFLKGVGLDKPALSGRVTGDAWQMELTTLIAFAKIDIPCIEPLNTRLSDRVGVLLAFLMDLNAIPGGNKVIIILEDRRTLNIHDCARQLESELIPFESGDVPESISRHRTSTGRIMTVKESLMRYQSS